MGIAARDRGFTLVELVMVLILLGVLSALGVGLFSGRSAFSPLLATQQLASATLLAQQAALAGNESDSLLIQQTADVFRFTVGPGTPSDRVFEFERAGASLSVVGGLPFSVTFNDLGSPSSSANTTFTFTGDTSFQTCLSSLGAVYVGACQ